MKTTVCKNIKEEANIKQSEEVKKFLANIKLIQDYLKEIQLHTKRLSSYKQELAKAVSEKEKSTFILLMLLFN